MDDAFADFLGELGALDASGGGEAPPSPKRARTAEDAEAEAAAAEAAAEAAAARKRLARGEKLRKAAYAGDKEKVDRLLGGLSAVDRLLLVDAADADDGFAALHLAVIRGHLAVVSALLRWRADVDAASDTGDTPLMWAAHTGNMEACKVLLRAGADTSPKNMRGKTAAAQARGGGHRRLAEFIENHAFDVAAGLQRKGVAAMDAAAARRAANMALLEAAETAQREKEEEEAFWAGVRARKAGRGEGEEAGANKEAAGAGEGSAEGGAERPKAFAEESLAALPAKVRPHYRTLEAPADSTEDEVRRLYRKLALRHHPDKNPADPKGAKERFTAIALAYEAVCEHLGKAGSAAGARIAPPKF